LATDTQRVRAAGRKQRGAAMVEFAVTIGLFMVLVIAIFEFVLMVTAFSRANEATRDVLRNAIVRVPEPGAGFVFPGPGNPTSDAFFEGVASRQLRQEWLPNLRLEYAPLAGSAGAFNVTAWLEGAEYQLFAPGLLGLNTTINVPEFRTSRLAENLQIP
jgi:Flp pilus assembly pilin Flp